MLRAILLKQPWFNSEGLKPSYKLPKNEILTMASLRMPQQVPGVRLPPQQNPKRAGFTQLCAAGDLTKIENFLRVFQSTDNTTDSTIRRSMSIYEYGFCEAVCHGKMDVRYLMRQGYLFWSISAAVEHATNSGSTEMLEFFVNQGWDPNPPQITDANDPRSRLKYSRISYVLSIPHF